MTTRESDILHPCRGAFYGVKKTVLIGRFGCIWSLAELSREQVRGGEPPPAGMTCQRLLLVHHGLVLCDALCGRGLARCWPAADQPCPRHAVAVYT